MSDPKPAEGETHPQSMRVDYAKSSLDENDLRADPFEQFAAWFVEANEASIPEPNAMTLATVGDRGLPSARIVLLKDYDSRGFTFFTNYQSRKGGELSIHPVGALCFLWQVLERQVRVEGRVEKVSREESVAYFSKRPRNSQIGAWVSEQSKPIPSREELERMQREITDRFADGEVPCPEFWGGFRVVPSAIEFWQGRRSRLHDRFLYTREDGGIWSHERLAP